MAAIDVKTSCYYNNCAQPPRWALSTEHSKLPDGQTFRLYTCDEHFRDLTNDCRKAGARYRLTPLEDKAPEAEQKSEGPIAEEKQDRAFLGGLPWPIRVLAILVVVIIGLAITPLVIGFYLFKSLFFGWKPPQGGI
jgi:hypothetical protein